MTLVPAQTPGRLQIVSSLRAGGRRGAHRAPRQAATIPAGIILLGCLLAGADLGAQEPLPSSVEDRQEAGEASAARPARRLVKWNEYEGPLFTLRASAGVILDAGTYLQDDASREQFDLEPDRQVRDFRVLFNGRIQTKRKITWSAGFIYDSSNKEWLMRQTGVMVAVPELKGHVFVGRSKEGISLNMIMVGYAAGPWSDLQPRLVHRRAQRRPVVLVL